MAQQSFDEEFTEYVRSKSPWLCKIAYLLCQDPHRADDLVQTSITKLYVNWRRARQMNHLDAYARTILVNTFLTEQRSGWWRRVVLHRDQPDTAADAADLDDALTVRAALAEIAPRQRAAIVLRYYCDLSSLAVFPAGVSPVDPAQVGTSPAPAVGGAVAYWQTAPADQAPSPGEVVLDWEYGANSWAELSLALDGAQQSSAAAQNTAIQIAQQVRFGQSAPVPLPFRHVAGPAGLTTVTAGWTELNPGIIADATWEETLSFASGPRPPGASASDTGTGDAYSSLEIGVTQAELPAADAGFTDDLGQTQQTTNTTVDGFAATIITSPGYTLLTVNNAKGFGTIEIQGTGAEADALAAPGAAAAFFGRLELMGADKASWTTDVVG